MTGMSSSWQVAQIGSYTASLICGTLRIIIGTEGIIHIQDTFPNLGIVDGNRLHSPDTTYWPMFEGVRGGALRAEFEYFANCALMGIAPKIGRPEDAAAALEATLAAEESARTGNVVRIG